MDIGHPGAMSTSVNDLRHITQVRLNANKDMKLSAYMMMAKGSTLMVKIDVL